jgi:hypothetical protein
VQTFAPLGTSRWEWVTEDPAVQTMARWRSALLLGGLLAVVLAAQAASTVPKVPRGKGERCVEPTEVMRRDHMRFLLHQRDATVHQGIRTTRHSLQECISCHVQRDEGTGRHVPVNAPGQFCSSCHTYAAVRIDCFECHATTPGNE